MTVEELYSEFNLFYNNIASNQAPGLDNYEISVYLTKAQETLVDALYLEFEHSENTRRKLANLVKTKKLSAIITTSDNMLYPEYTTVYSEPSDCRNIVNEQLRMAKNADKCIRGKVIDLQPVLHDEVDSIIENPFRFNYKRGLRLDASYNNQKVIEILTKDKHIDYYQIRYIQNPLPIILTNSLNSNLPEDAGMQINGVIFSYNNSSNGSLIPELHRQLIEYAAKMAYQDYKQ